MMKILHVLDHSIPLHSGYTFRTRAILKQQGLLGIETCHLTSPKHGNHNKGIETVDDLTFYRAEPISGLIAKLPGLHQISYIKPTVERILEVIDIEKPDLIHAHSPALNGFAAISAGRAANLPVVYEVRAFWEDAAVNHGWCRQGGVRYWLTRKLENYVLKQVDAITTICDGLRDDLIGRGFCASKITVIPNAVDTQRFNVIKQKDTDLVSSLGLENCQVLGFLGSFYAYEGLDLIITALPKILQQNQNVRLLLVGSGPQKAKLEQLVVDLGLRQQVIFTGRVAHDDISRFYSLVDLLVYPRKSMRLTELVTPLKPLEAMAQGKLCLVSDVGGHHELITHGENGFMFKADDVEALSHSVNDILSRPQQWPTVLEQARNYVQSARTWSSSVANYLAIYNQLLHGKR
jgi:PEP-CTERM/exosortase A-associated glycosyltransferase